MSWNWKNPRLAWLNTPSSTTLNPALVGLVDEPAKRVVAAEHRVDFLVVVRVVAMVRGRLEDRREVDRVDAQVGQVVELLDHADEVASLVSVAWSASPQASRWVGLATVRLLANRSGKI